MKKSINQRKNWQKNFFNVNEIKNEAFITFGNYSLNLDQVWNTQKYTALQGMGMGVWCQDHKRSILFFQLATKSHDSPVRRIMFNIISWNIVIVNFILPIQQTHLLFFQLSVSTKESKDMKLLNIFVWFLKVCSENLFAHLFLLIWNKNYFELIQEIRIFLFNFWAHLPHIFFTKFTKKLLLQ